MHSNRKKLALGYLSFINCMLSKYPPITDALWLLSATNLLGFLPIIVSSSFKIQYHIVRESCPSGLIKFWNHSTGSHLQCAVAQWITETRTILLLFHTQLTQHNPLAWSPCKLHHYELLLCTRATNGFIDLDIPLNTLDWLRCISKYSSTSELN